MCSSASSSSSLPGFSLALRSPLRVECAWRCKWTTGLAFVSLLVAPANTSTHHGIRTGVCQDAASCRAEAIRVADILAETSVDMAVGQRVADAAHEIRSGLFAGERRTLGSNTRQHLADGVPLLRQVSHDWKHRPISTNRSRHLKHLGRVLPQVDARFFTFLPLRESPTSDKASSALVLGMHGASVLSLQTLAGEAVFDDFDLGHGTGRRITHVAVTSTLKNRFIVAADENCTFGLHSLQLRRERRDGEELSMFQDLRKRFAAFAGYQTDVESSYRVLAAIKRRAEFVGPMDIDFCSAERAITSLLVGERNSIPYIVVGDALGEITMLSNEGKLIGRVRVTEDPDGVRGLRLGPDQTVLFYSSLSFGFFSLLDVDLVEAPCDGWLSPLVDVAPDPAASYEQVVLALSDGDNLVFSRHCELLMKFPRVSVLPFQLHGFQGYTVGMATTSLACSSASPACTSSATLRDYPRELYVFNADAMHALTGEAPTRSITAQVTLGADQPESFALFPLPEGSGDRSEALLALKLPGAGGVELFRVTVKSRFTAERLERSRMFNIVACIVLFSSVLILVILGIYRCCSMLDSPENDKKDGKNPQITEDAGSEWPGDYAENSENS